jgi:hypothetical protein
MGKFARAELEEMMRRWLKANEQAEAENDWATHLTPFYTEDAVYYWNLGPREDFIAHGRQQIHDWGLGTEMEGLEGWKYFYEQVLIDEEKGEIVGFWKQIAPFKRPDGSNYEIAGTGGSWFRYAGDFMWCWQRDFFDSKNMAALFRDLARDGHLSSGLKTRIEKAAKGEALPGHVKYASPRAA